MFVFDLHFRAVPLPSSAVTGIPKFDTCRRIIIPMLHNLSAAIETHVITFDSELHDWYIPPKITIGTVCVRYFPVFLKSCVIKYVVCRNMI
jgi:hypothetical protein